MASELLETLSKHKTMIMVATGGLIGLFILSRNGSSSSSNSVPSALLSEQSQMAQTNAQLSAAQMQLTAQQNIAQIQANQQDSQTAAALAALQLQTQSSATVAGQQTQAEEAVALAQNQAAESVAMGQIGAVNNQTNQEANVYGETINANVTEQQNAIQAELQAQQNQQAFESAMAPYVTTFNGSQNRLSYLQSVLGQPGAASETQMSEAAINNPAYNPFSMDVNSIANAVKALFG